MHAISGGEWARATLNSRYIVRGSKEVHKVPLIRVRSAGIQFGRTLWEWRSHLLQGGIVNQIRDTMNTIVGPVRSCPSPCFYERRIRNATESDRSSVSSSCKAN